LKGRTTSSDKQSYYHAGNVAGVRWMLVTQSAFNGYNGMDPSEIPQFEAGERDVIALVRWIIIGRCSTFKRSPDGGHVSFMM
jgi:hypothetical protein